MLDYQQRHTYSGSETATDGSLEPLQIIFSIVVKAAGLPKEHKNNNTS
jgi:hypothetical protein